MSLTIRDTLMWYKRPEVRQAMLEGARNKEIGVRFGESFGKRPDALEYEQEILDAVQRGATSFHASEEIWSNPRAIETGMNKERTNDIRIGWDVILDVDFTNFAATKLITKALCDQLNHHHVHSYGVKFSGNKGFHIGIPWEAFPSEFQPDEQKPAVPTRTLFPEAARAIADYLVDRIDGPHNEFALTEAVTKELSVEEINEHVKQTCAGCGKERKEKQFSKYFVCPRCQHHEVAPFDAVDHVVCPKCSSFMNFVPTVKKEKDGACEHCGSTKVRKTVDLKIDTQLVSSRHLYRLEYSLHEKSGLVSLPIPISQLSTFSREQAQPEKITELPSFWNRSSRGEAKSLFIAAQHFSASIQNASFVQKEVVWDDAAAPEENFPPTITKMLKGMEDGKKRALFILTNFFRSVGWNHDMIEERLLEWNKQNNPSLRDAEITSHLRYHKQRNQTVLPPNFENDVYKDLGVLVHDDLSMNTKNPVQYVRLRLKQRGPQEKESKDKPKKSTVKDTT